MNNLLLRVNVKILQFEGFLLFLPLIYQTFSLMITFPSSAEKLLRIQIFAE